MPSMTDLDYTDTMDANKQPFLTDFRASLDSIETYVNTLKKNFIQVSTDAYGSAYGLDGDGLPQFTNNLYNKQTASDTDATGDHTLSTTGAWMDVDATNASCAITPEFAGDFKADFQFNVEVVTTNATNEAKMRFRLTDGTSFSDAIAKVHQVTGVSGTTHTVPVHLSHKFASWTAAAKTVKLQYFADTLTNATVKALANNTHPIAMAIEKV